MAMKKEILKESGLTASYHKIKNIIINEVKEQCIVTLEEYIDETYRDKAKEVKETLEAIDEMYHQIYSVKDEAIVNALLEKVETLQARSEELVESKYYIGENVVTLDYIPEDTTVTGFYNELKKIDRYADSEEI